MGDTESDPWVNSICSVYAHLIENQVKSGDPDVEKVVELTGYIKQYCTTASFPAGETPEHLEEYLYESD